MALFRKVYSYDVHRDPRFTRRSDDAQLTYLRAIFHPDSTLMGTLVITPRRFGAEWGWDEARTVASLTELSTAGRERLVDWDRRTGLMVFTHIAGHPPRNAEVILGQWPDAFDSLPRCPTKSRLRATVLAALRNLPPAVRRDLGPVWPTFAKSGTSEAAPGAVPVAAPEHEGVGGLPTRTRDEHDPGGVSAPPAGEDLAVVLRAREARPDLFNARENDVIDTAESGEALSGPQLRWLGRLARRARRLPAPRKAFEPKATITGERRDGR